MRLAVLEAIHEVAGTSDIAGASMANLSDLRGIEAAVIQTLESSEKEGSSKKKR
jgi:hypothetical protein